ncbi:DUF1684 domain-containing protein [soil metagenome]
MLHYRRLVAAMYARVRSGEQDQAELCANFRRERDQLFAEHPQSPLPAGDKDDFEGLDYFDYDPSLRYILPVEYDVEPDELEIQLQEDGLLRLRRFGRVQFTGEMEESSLSLFWVEGYGGGVFLPFKDATSGRETYGGGRYLLDTIKYADLGEEDGRMVLDFNYAYNPSCAYNPEWVCPLSSPENTLPVEIRAGEKAYDPQAERL